MTTANFQRARTAEQQDQRRRDILATAHAMLDELPLADISLRELSSRVGLAKSNVVRYFPTREAVFLAVLADDWEAWLDVLEARLPRADRRRSARRTHELVSGAIAETLAEHPRLCNLIAASQAILEHNIPLETARTFKSAAMSRTQRLAGLVQARMPELTDEQAFELAGISWALLVGAWPAANPSPSVAAVLDEPEFAALRVDFVPTFAHALTVVLDGFAAS